MTRSSHDSVLSVSKSSVPLTFLLISILFSASSFAQPVSITDFRIPTSNYQRLIGSLSGYWNKNTSDQSSLYPNSSSGSNASTSNGFSYILGQFSEDRSLEVNTSIGSSYSGSSYSSDYPADPSHYGNTSTVATVSLNPYVRYSGYLEPDTWFWTAQGQGYGSYEYDHGTTTQRGYGMDTTWKDYTKVRNFQYSVSAGVGYGKLRDGQPIFAALRMLDKLQEDGAFIRPLTREEVLTLADTLARQSEYAYSQDRYYKFLMKDFFKLLESMGVIKGSAASAFDVMRAFEVLLYERIEPRLFGWRVSASLMHTTSQNDYQTNSSSSYYNNYREYLQLQGEYGYPVSLNTELSANCTLLVPNKDYKRRIEGSLGARAAYQVTDRIDAMLGYTLSRASSSNASDDRNNFARYFQHQVSMAFIFFIENSVSFNVSAAYQHARTDYFYPQSIGPMIRSSYYSGSFGLSYRFL